MKALDDIEKLVAEVAREAASGNMGIHEKMDALKLLQPYYATMKKAKSRADDDPSGEELTMSTIQQRVAGAEEQDDGTKIPPASRRTRN